MTKIMNICINLFRLNLAIRQYRNQFLPPPLQTNLRFKRDNPKRTFKLATEEEILEQEAAEEAAEMAWHVVLNAAEVLQKRL